jgi:hypothetical protein
MVRLTSVSPLIARCVLSSLFIQAGQALQSLRTQSVPRAVSVSVAANPGASVFVSCDAAQLRQIVARALSNALKVRQRSACCFVGSCRRSPRVVGCLVGARGVVGCCGVVCRLSFVVPHHVLSIITSSFVMSIVVVSAFV